MSVPQQALLRQAWLEGCTGHLSAMSEAKAWALREVWRSEHDSDWGLASFVAARVTKVGGGAPQVPAISKFFKKIDQDPEWFPGKSYQTQFGPKPALSGQAKIAIAHAAMSMKKRKIEPTLPWIAAVCPQAVISPTTGTPVGKKRAYAVFRTLCYDEDPDHPWSHRNRFYEEGIDRGESSNA